MQWVVLACIGLIAVLAGFLGRIMWELDKVAREIDAWRGDDELGGRRHWCRVEHEDVTDGE